MCMGGGGGGGTTTVQRIDPTPTAVQVSEVAAGDKDLARKKKRDGFRSTVKENRGGTILGDLSNSSSTEGTRKFLGSKD